MYKRKTRGGKGRGGRRGKSGLKVKKIVMQHRYKSGKEKDDKLMKKFAKVEETPPVKKNIKVDPKELIDLEMVSDGAMTLCILYLCILVILMGKMYTAIF